MKYSFILILNLCFFLIAVFQPASAQDNKKDNIRIVKLQTSAHTVQCKGKIEKTLAFEKGVIESELDKKTRILTVKYKSNKTDVGRIIKAVTDLGHTAEEITEKK